MAAPLSRRFAWQQKLADEVAAGLTRRIESGEAVPGTPLGSRDALATEFVTTRGVVDRALDGLLDAGILAEEAGELRVAALPATRQGFALPGDLGERIEDVQAILELRLGIEVVAAALAARRASPEALDAIRAAAAAYADTAGTPASAAQADLHFHRAVAAASGNPYILELLDDLGPLLIPRMRVPMPDARGDGNIAKSLSEHSAIVEAIARRDSAAARDAMRDHLWRTIELMRSLDAAGA